MDNEGDRIVVYESTIRELLKVDMDGMSAKQIRDHVGALKDAWERFLAAAPRSQPETE